MAETLYINIQNEKFNQKTGDLLSKLPPFVTSYINEKYQRLSSRTKYAYVVDIYIFFRFLQMHLEKIPDSDSLKKIDLKDLIHVNSDLLIKYSKWLQEYTLDGKTHKNSLSGILRKFSSLSGLFKYLAQTNQILANPFGSLDRSVIVKQFNRPESSDFQTSADTSNVSISNEILLNAVNPKDPGLSHQKKLFSKLTELRDRAILFLLLGTGLQVSELVGINLEDISFDQHRIRIMKENNGSVYIYTNQLIEDVLADYLDHGRDYFKPVPEYENAFFLSRRHRRITERAVEQLVHRYGELAFGKKGTRVTPGLLRKQFARNLYHLTGDPYVTSAALHRKTLSNNLVTVSANVLDQKVASVLQEHSVI